MRQGPDLQSNGRAETDTIPNRFDSLKATTEWQASSLVVCCTYILFGRPVAQQKGKSTALTLSRHWCEECGMYDTINLSSPMST